MVAVYYPVHRQPFANYDDPDYVTDNLHVRAGLHWETVKWALTTHAAANWHPVTWLSHALDTELFGLSPAWPHDVNVVFHILNALLLFWILQRTTGFVGRSWMVAALFALHPVNVESVAWIAERKNLLSMFFLLLTLGAYRWYAEKPRGSRYFVVAVFFALGLMSKPQVITLPFILLLWDYWPLERFSFAAESSDMGKAALQRRVSRGANRSAPVTPSFDASLKAGSTAPYAHDAAATVRAIPIRSLSALLWEKVPLLAMCVASAVLTINAQAAGGATSYYGRLLRLENAIVAYARYLGKALWPSGLALFYPYPLKPFPLWQVGLSALLLLVITVAVALAYRRRYLTVGWLWFLGTLVPMIGLIQVGTQAMADRYAYLPFVGLFIMVCWTVADSAVRLHSSPMLLRVVSAAVLLALGLLSHRQIGYWNDHITLWTHTLEVTHDNWVGENNLGTALLKLGRVEEAIPHFRAAAALDPTDPNSVLNIGTYEQMHGNFPAAIELYKKAANLARNPKTKARAYNNLAYAYKDSGDLADALTSLQNAVRIDPEFAGAWISLGLVAQKTGDLPLAISSYSRALQVQPSDFGYLLLSSALQLSGEAQQAANARHQAEQLSPNIISAQHYVDKLLQQ